MKGEDPGPIPMAKAGGFHRASRVSPPSKFYNPKSMPGPQFYGVASGSTNHFSS